MEKIERNNEELNKKPKNKIGKIIISIVLCIIIIISIGCCLLMSNKDLLNSFYCYVDRIYEDITGDYGEIIPDF